MSGWWNAGYNSVPDGMRGSSGLNFSIVSTSCPPNTDSGDSAAAAAVAVPTMLMARDDWAEDAQRWAQANMPGASFATMPHHMGFVTDPEGFNATIRNFAR